MKVMIEIRMDNEAFAEGGGMWELQRILRELAGDVPHRDLDGLKLRDVNGNTVGKVAVMQTKVQPKAAPVTGLGRSKNW